MLKFAKFIGANTDFATAQAFLYPRILPEDLSGYIFGLVVSGEGDDIFVKVRQKILSLEGIFNEPFERITDNLHELFEKLKLEFSEVENLKLTLFASRDKLFYVLQLGDNLVEILREGNRSPIIQSNFAQEKIISGILKTGDRVLILSAKPNGIWSDEVINQIFLMPGDNIPDAEVVFAQDELRVEQREDLAGVKDIQPVAFIRIENEAEGINKELQAEIEEKPKVDFRINISLSHMLLFLHKISRQGFGLIRQTNELVPFANKRVLVAALILLLLVLAIGGGFVYYKSQLSAKNIRRDNLILLIEANLAQARVLEGSDQKGAVSELNKAQERLKELSDIDPKDTRVIEIKKKAEEISSEVLKIYKNFDLELFLSLDLINPDFQTRRMSFSIDKLLLLSSDKSLVAVDLKLKTPQILAGSQQLGDAKPASVNGSDAFVHSQDKGLIHIDMDSEKLSVVFKVLLRRINTSPD